MVHNEKYDGLQRKKGVLAKTPTVGWDGEQQFVGGLLSLGGVIKFPSNESGRQGEYGGRSG